MGMYTELNIGVEIANDRQAINILKYMLGDSDIKPELPDAELFNTSRWEYMLRCDSYYFDGQTDSKLFEDALYGKDNPKFYLNVRCNLKNYDSEIDCFMKWLCPYIITDGFLGYKRYEECEDPTLIYMENEKIVMK